MTVPTATDPDVERILARRNENGGDHWATADGRVYVGNPFSTIGSLLMLHELDVPADHEAVAGGLERILACVRSDGRIRVAPRAPLYPCYTAEAARTLRRFGRHEAVSGTVDQLLASFHETGGWRCPFSRFGRGPETESCSPGATLYVLDVLRFDEAARNGVPAVDRAVDALLDHWDRREPSGPCHHGIGSRFLRVEYPFVRYNLFYWVYVLSFFQRARSDPRFTAAHAVLAGKVDDCGRMVVEAPHRGLGGLDFCARGRPSSRATRRWLEIGARFV